MKRTYRQLEIWWVDLEPTRGSETKKKRPCVIVQSELLNPHSETIIIAPLLPGHKSWPFVVNLTPSKQNGVDKNRHINLKQLRAIDLQKKVLADEPTSFSEGHAHRTPGSRVEPIVLSPLRGSVRFALTRRGSAPTQKSFS